MRNFRNTANLRRLRELAPNYRNIVMNEVFGGGFIPLNTLADKLGLQKSLTRRESLAALATHDAFRKLGGIDLIIDSRGRLAVGSITAFVFKHKCNYN